MKKTLAAILAVLYLFTACGATLHLHYCMGRLSSWSLASDEKAACGSCGMVKKKGCCDEKTKLIKLAGDQKTAVSSIQFSNLAPAVSPVFYANSLVLPVCYEKVTCRANAPPGILQRPLYLLYSVYRI